jgi:hypothetical protein
MDGYDLLKGTIKMSSSICNGCTLGGTTFQSLPGFLPQMEAELAALEIEVEALRYRNSNLLRRLDPQTTFELLDGAGEA